MHELEEKLKDVKEMKERLLSLCKMELAKNVEEVCTEELGQVIDMVKDLAEVEEKCAKSKYYMTVTEAMEAAEEDPRYGDMRAGYDHYRYKSGRYAPKGRGHYVSGYIPMEMMADPEFEKEFGDMMRMGYQDTRGRQYRMDGGGETRSSGYHDGRGRESKYGRAYDDFQDARRHYTESRSDADKKKMDAHANEHIAGIVASTREMWDAADPMMRKNIKQQFTNLLGEMVV